MRIIVLIFIMTSFAVNAQHKVVGEIYDTENQPIQYVNIVGKKGDSIVLGTVTDERGRFILFHNHIDTLDLCVSFVGYKTIDTTLIIKGAVNLSRITLDVDINSLSGVDIIAKSVDTKIDRTVYNVPSNVQKQSIDSYQVLQQTPFLEVNSTTNSVGISGKKNIMILINNIRKTQQDIAGVLPENIDRVEVITSPSARYLAKDVEGVINIITKDKVQGYVVNYGLKLNPLLSFGISDLYYKHNKNKLSFFLIGQAFAMNEDERNSRSVDNRMTETLQTMDERESFSSEFLFVNYYLKAGIEYEIDEDSYLIVSANGFINDMKNNGKNRGRYFENDNLVREYTTRSNLNTDAFDQKYNIYFQRKLKKKRMITLDFHINRFSVENQSSFIYEQNIENTLNKNELKESYDLQIDYTTPIGKNSTIELGNRSFLHNYDLNYDYSGAASDNNFKYRELVSYTYINLIGKIGHKFGWQLSSTGDLTMRYIDDVHVKDFIKFLPSINLHYSFNDVNSITFNYNMFRTSPISSRLNPFNQSLDTAYIQYGNSQLSPYYTHNTEMKYSLNMKKLLITPSINYQYASDIIAVTGNLRDLNTYVGTYRNMANYLKFSNKIYFMYRPFSWWRMGGTFSYNYEEYKDDIDDLSQNLWAFGFNMWSFVNYKKMAVNFRYNQSAKSLDGISKKLNGIESEITLQYKLSKFKIQLGTRWVIPYKSQSWANSENYTTYNELVIKERFMAVLVGFRYYFSSGKQSMYKRKRIDNQDNGIE